MYRVAGLRKELFNVVVFVAVVWMVYAWQYFAAVEQFGLVPRTLRGLVGVFSMPFLHASFTHLLSNTWPLLVLLSFVAGSRTKTWPVVTALVLTSGILTWCFARGRLHIGASALVFGLIAFLIASGYFERKPRAVIVSVCVALLYGTTLLVGILPLNWEVSWDGHLCGAIAGVVVAFAMSRPPLPFKANHVQSRR